MREYMFSQTNQTYGTMDNNQGFCENGRFGTVGGRGAVKEKDDDDDDEKEEEIDVDDWIFLLFFYFLVILTLVFY